MEVIGSMIHGILTITFTIEISRFLGKHEWILYEVETKSSPGFTAFLTGIGLHLEGDQKQIQTDSKEHAYGGFRVPRCCPKR